MNTLVSVDFSEVTSRVIEVVGSTAQAREGKVYLLHVAEPDPDFVGYEAGPQTVRDQVAAEYRREHQELESLADTLRERGIEVTPLLVQGAIVETVLDQALKLDASLIVVGSHGHGATYDLLVGSISAGIIRKSTVPVLVVPGRN